MHRVSALWLSGMQKVNRLWIVIKIEQKKIFALGPTGLLGEETVLGSLELKPNL